MAAMSERNYFEVMYEIASEQNEIRIASVDLKDGTTTM